MDTNNKPNRFIKVKFLTSTTGESSKTQYFYSSQGKMVIPLYDVQTDIRVPTTTDVFERTLHAFQIKIPQVHVYKQKDDIFYSYLGLYDGENIKRVNIGLSDAIALAKTFESSIYIEGDIISNHGIKVTKELLESSLAI